MIQAGMLTAPVPARPLRYLDWKTRQPGEKFSTPAPERGTRYHVALRVRAQEMDQSKSKRLTLEELWREDADGTKFRSFA